MSFGWHDLIGNIGVSFVLLTYLLVQTDRLSVQTYRYCGLNAAGAILILVSLSIDFNLSSFIIEIAWLIISGMGVVRVWSRRRARA